MAVMLHALLAGRRALGRASAFALACSALTACAPAGEDIASAEAPIAGGKIDLTDSAVVAFYYLAESTLCSGTLIAPNVVLTAHHCVAPTIDKVAGGVSCSKTKFGEPGSPVSFLVTTSPHITIGNAGEYLVREIVLAPAADDLFCGNDVAILILQSNIDAAVATPYVPRVDAPLVEKEVYSAIGFGATDDFGSGAGTRRRRDDLVVSCVGDGCSTAVVKSTEWNGDTGICHGDSGGPALDAQNRVIGVTSRGKMNCDAPVYGDVFSWGQWLKDTVAYASGLGAYPLPAWAEGAAVDPEHSMPVGDVCVDEADCFNGKCLDDGVESYCTRACDDVAPCPEGFECDAELGVCSKLGRDPKPAEEKNALVEPRGCAVGPADQRPRGATWFGGAAVLAALAAVARRRGRAARRRGSSVA